MDWLLWMKTRLGFVSNSSSSSYIIAAEDNPHMMVLSDPEILTFKELTDSFGSRLFGPTPEFASFELRINEVSDDEFTNRFMSDEVFAADGWFNPYVVHMPHDAVYPYAAYRAMMREWSSSEFESIKKVLASWGSEYDGMHELYTALLKEAADAVVEACYKVLEPAIGSMKFCYQEMTDMYRGYLGEESDDPFSQSIDPDAPRKRGSCSAEKVMMNRKYKAFYSHLIHPTDEMLVQARISFLESILGRPLRFKRSFSNH